MPRLSGLLATVWMLAACGPDEPPGMPPGECAPPSGDYDVTLASLLGEMADLEGLAAPLDPSYRVLQASSYDRRSTTPEDAEGWFGNVDRGHMDSRFERQGRTEHVLLDARGPGALLRLWSAGLSATEGPEGTLRVYLDCDVEPRLEVPLGALLEGRLEPFTEPFGYNAAGGGNLYFPIPFAARALVTVDAGADDRDRGLYYHLGYRLYEDGTRVESFEMSHVERDQAAVLAARAALSSAEAPAPPGEPVGDEVVTGGAPFSVEALPGGSAFTQLRVTPSVLTAEALRRTLLVVRFDEVETVRAPLSDFFGSGLGFNPVRTLAFTVDASGYLETRFWMPFGQHAEVALEGPADLPMRAQVEARLAPSDSPLRFFAQYRSSNVIDSGRQDFGFLRLEGAGHYVGNTLTVTNPVSVWWGEGDEKIYVDDDDFPSTFGTGTEDYYGYAWLNALFFERPYHAQPRPPADPEHRGITSLHRSHILDPLSFSDRLRFDMEIWHWWPRIELVYDTVQYWYGTVETDHDFEPVTPDELFVPDVDALDATWE